MATQDAQGNYQLTPEEEQVYLANNPDVAQAIANEQAGLPDDPSTPKWKGSVSDHLNYAIKEKEARNLSLVAPPPETPSDPLATQASVDALQQKFDEFKPVNVTSGGGDYRTMNITQGPDIDYGRIQGFIGTPEVRDEEGNITQEATGIYAQPGGLMSGQQDLMTGQQTLGTGQGVLAEGQTALAAGQQGIMGGQQALGEGQQAIGGAIGVASENQPQTLFGGQMALGQGQAGITSGVQGLGRDLTTLTGDLSDFESAQRQYQLAAEGQRAQGREIGMTTRDQLENQLRTVGAQTNRMAEQQAQMRQQGMMAPQPAPQVQQASQAAQIAGQNLRSFAPQGGGMMGPTGPVAVDPRDQVGFGPTRSPV